MRTLLYPEWLVDGTGAPARQGQVVVVEGERITAVASAGEISPDEHDHAVHLPGASLLPGLINHHVHLTLPGDDPYNTLFLKMDSLSDTALGLQAAHSALVSLRAGVTTVRDCGGRREIVLDVRDAQRAGLVQGSRVVSCGWTITITGGHTRMFGGEADGKIAVRQMVRRLVSRGVDFIKVMGSGGGTPGTLPGNPSYSVAELRAIVETAHELGKTVTVHCTATEAIRRAVKAKVDFIEHAMFSTPTGPDGFDERVAQALADSGIRVTPTLQANRHMVEALPPGPDLDAWRARLERHERDISRLRELGVPLLGGSDAGWRGIGFDTYWQELDELVVCGMAPVEAISASTGRLSEALGLGAMLGTVKPGLLADLLVVEGDVASDIRCLARVHSVYQGGVLARQ